uniref:Histone H2A/H2B/H3 domain-containing protein n=1 Tax=Ditylenchus dipsaci TaxID=166011 RepID=A0A915DCY5_9BILA
MARTKMASNKKADAKGSQEVPVKTAGVDKKEKRKKARNETFASHIYRVLKQVHPEIGMSSQAMSVMNSFVRDIFERIAAESGRLAQHTRQAKHQKNRPSRRMKSRLLFVSSCQVNCPSMLSPKELRPWLSMWLPKARSEDPRFEEATMR